MEEALGLRSDREPFGEKDFYLEELRGRSVLVALAPRVVAERAPLDPLAATVAELMRNGTRVLVWWPAGRIGTERRLLKAIERHARPRRKGKRRGDPSPVLAVKLGNRATWDGEGLSALLWQRVRRRRLCILSVTGLVASAYPDHVTAMAIDLRVPKVVLVEPDGGLVASGSRLSFVDGLVLDTLLAPGRGRVDGPRRTPGIARGRRPGAGRGRRVGQPLRALGGRRGALHRTPARARSSPSKTTAACARWHSTSSPRPSGCSQRGQREGMLKFRRPEELAQVLATAYGATICDRHLAGVAALLTAPYADERVGEIVGLYTITRFKGEGSASAWSMRLLTEADRRGLAVRLRRARSTSARSSSSSASASRACGSTPCRRQVGGLRRAPAEPRRRLPAEPRAGSAWRRAAVDDAAGSASLGILVLALGVGLAAVRRPACGG